MKKIRIYYNPYDKNFIFKYASNGINYEKIDGRSNLVNFMNKPVLLSNVAHDIIKIIDQKYSIDANGIEIEFCGTDCDYNDLVNIFNNYIKFTAHNNKVCLRLIQSKSYKLMDPKEAINQIEDAYTRIKSEFSIENDNISKEENEIAELVDRYNDTTKSELNIVVAGTYSSGKSTFINALIGEELLPQGDDPVTGQISQITSADQYSITFELNKSYNDNRSSTVEVIKICWNKGNFNFELDKNESLENKSELLQDIKKHINDSKKASTVEQMRSVISFFDKCSRHQNKGYQLTPSIHVTLPFTIGDISQNQFTIKIFDTPGSNAQIAPQHLSTLKKALEQQTNAIPLLIINRNDLVNSNNDDLKKLVNEYSGSLDVANALTIITKGDEISLDSLNKGIDDDVLKEWNFSKILFFSSVVALGLKKEGKLVDPSYREKYVKAKVQYAPDAEFYSQLYRYAILPKTEYDEITKEAQKSKPEKLIAFNCGLYAIEFELKNYMEKCILFIKAKQRSSYLIDALKKAEGLLDQKKQEQVEEKAMHEVKKKEKLEELEDKLIKFETVDDEFQKIREEMKNEFGSQVDFFIKGLEQMTELKWKQIKNQKLNSKEKQNELHNKMVLHCNAFILQIFPKMDLVSKEKHLTLSKSETKRLFDIIQMDDQIAKFVKDRFLEISRIRTPEYTSSTIPNFNKDKAFSNFLFFHFTNPPKYAKQLERSFRVFYMKNCVELPRDTHEKQYKDWLCKAKLAYGENFHVRNLALRDYEERINKNKSEIDELTKRLEKLSGVKNFLAKLLEFPEDGNYE